MHTKQLTLIHILVCLLTFVIVASGQTKSGEFYFLFSEADLQKVYNNSGEQVKLNFTVQGFKNKNEIKSFKEKCSLKKLKCKYKDQDAVFASAVFPLNIDAFRTELENNSVEIILINGNKIKVSNLISQEKATELSSTVIDVAPMQFQAHFNNADNLDHFDFNIYYFETKLFHSMHNYQKNLLRGAIDRLQESLKNAREERNDFIRQHSGN